MKKILFLIPLTLIILSGCGNIKSYSRDIFAMDTYMSVKAYGENAENAVSECEQLIYQLDSELSVTNEESCIYRLNSADGEPVEVTENAAEIIRMANEISSKTDGALDITMYPLVKEWGFIDSHYNVPEDEKIAVLLKNVGYENIQLNGNTVQMPENCQIDLGSAAKGYTGDMVIEKLKENGVKSAVINLGGNVQTLGMKPDGTNWKVAVRSPFEADKNICELEIGEKAVVTSGNYERCFSDEEKMYWHILDPEDGYPADNGIISVTVIGMNGMKCDALSTALFVMGKDKAVEFWRNNNDFDMILVTNDRKIYYTQELSGNIKNISDLPAEVIQHD